MMVPITITINMAELTDEPNIDQLTYELAKLNKLDKLTDHLADLLADAIIAKIQSHQLDVDVVAEMASNITVEVAANLDKLSESTEEVRLVVYVDIDKLVQMSKNIRVKKLLDEQKRLEQQKLHEL